MKLSRRNWLKAAGGVGAGLGISATGAHKLIPYLVPPRDVIPGTATWYATTCRECPAGCGMLVRCREGRAVKCEGNPDHPINNGALCQRGQAALQGLYDPDRIRQPRQGKGGAVTWDAALATVGELLRSARKTGRVAVISDLQTGSLVGLIRRWLEAFSANADRHLMFEPLNYAALRQGNAAVFGRDAIPAYRIDEADFILSLGADFLETWLSPVQYTVQFAAMRDPRGGRMGRFVYAGPRMSLTAANADERFFVRPGQEGRLGLAMLYSILFDGLEKRPEQGLPLRPEHTPEATGSALGIDPAHIRRLAQRLWHSKSVVLAGSPCGETREALDTAVAASLLNIWSPCVDFGREHALGRCADAERVREFVQAVGEGVDVLIILGANPVYSLPESHDLVRLIREGAKVVISLSPFLDETAAAADWVLPASHALESWGDYEPETGVRCLMQPTMGEVLEPKDGPMAKSVGDILLVLAHAAGIDAQSAFGAETFYEYLRNEWRALQRKVARDLDFETFWTEAVRAGGHWSERAPQPPLISQDIYRYSFAEPDESSAVRLHVYPSTALYDGRGANKAWLQELPDPMTHAVWGSWVEVSEEDAAQRGISPGDVLEVTTSAGSIEAPAVVSPQVAPGTVAVPLGQGHRAYGRSAQGVGANALPLVAFADADEPVTVTLEPAGRREALVTTDGDTSQHDREIVRTVALSRMAHDDPDHLAYPLPEGYSAERDLSPAHQHKQHRWGMVIDLSRCTGCGACVTACYAENNIAVVGRDEVARGREMSWLRIDRYYDPDSALAPALFLPMLCQHCDAAPCEPVCPVFAAVHSDDGLNAQVYNRCVGTRYCANNCPYKVRRFNWFDNKWPEPLNWQLNPDVTVRCRGVMEKCTFCVQRIREAQQQARLENRPLRDGDIVPACAQTCPARAIVFGDLMDPEARASQLMRGSPRAYQVLDELNTKPAVIYLKKILWA
ncbi:MAG: molybdopterin dinucleotide binding domain-containing protein [Armatimonadota bacterium]